MIVCTRCSGSNEPGRKFCGECGERLSLACGSCGAANQPEAKFCGECGSPIAGAAPSAAAIQPASPSDATERRLVSVLFVDLVGFTSFSEGRDAEDVRAMLGRYFEGASDAVARHGGAVEKFIGDAVMAVWGTPVAHEDDAERAVRSAIEIVDRVDALGRELGLPLRARAGVLTGEAVAALNATDQGFVTGDLVNTASRLQSAAEPGTVLVGERTYRATSQSIAYTQVEPLTVKGKDEKVPAYLALRILSELGGSNRGTAPEPPFIGRDEQLRLTKELLHATGREGRPRLLHVSGVAGIGKSRLVWELLKYLDGLTEGIFWHQGRCPAYGEGVAFWALAEMVRTRVGIADTDDSDTARRGLAACLAEYVSDIDERRWIEPRLGHLLGLEPAPNGDRDELFGAWRRFFERVAEHGTVALVIEDLHWADPGLMDFLEDLLESSRTSPILVLTLARPELMDRRPGWGHGVRSSSVLHLDRLGDDQIRTMVTSYVDGLPDEGLQRLVHRAEGVPMYAVETVRMLADRGVLEQRGEAYAVVGELGGELDIPETLHALVAARLDGLPDVERALVQDASVAGHSFTVATVSAVSGREPAEVEPHLRTLVRKEVLDQDVDPRSPERGQFRFVQSVIKEVAYSTLSKGARRAKHLACARWFEALDEDELTGIVANHFLEAYRADPAAADSEDVAAHAREWLGRAGDRALSLGSPSQSFAYTVQALSLSARPEERAPLHARAAYAAGAVNDLDAAWTHLVDGVEAYRAIGDAEAEATLLSGDASFLRFSLEQLTWVTDALAAVEQRLRPDQASARVRALARLSLGATHRGEYDEANLLSERAIVLAQTFDDDDDALLLVSGARASALANVGRHWEALQMTEARVDVARRSGRPMEISGAMMNLAVMQAEDDPRAAFHTFLDCAKVAEAAGLRPMQDLAMANASESGVDVGEWGVVDAILAELRGVEGTDDSDRDALDFTASMLRSHRGNAVGALATLEGISDRWGDTWGQVQFRTWFLRTRSYVHLLAGDDVSACADADTVIELEATGTNTPTTLWTGIQAACGLRDAHWMRAMLETTAPIRGRWIGLVRATARAACAALDGDDDADARVSVALDGWLEADLPLDHAFAVLCCARVTPSGTVPAEHVAEARAYLRGQDAETLLRLIDAATVA